MSNFNQLEKNYEQLLEDRESKRIEAKEDMEEQKDCIFNSLTGKDLKCHKEGYDCDNCPVGDEIKLAIESTTVNEVEENADEELSEEEIERRQVEIIKYGPRGVSWKEKQGVASIDNPILFTCAVCRKTLRYASDVHEKGCRVGLLNSLGM